MIDLKAELAKVKAERGERYAAYRSAVELAQAAVIRLPDGKAVSFRDAGFQQVLWKEGDQAIPLGSGARAIAPEVVYRDGVLVSQLEALRADSPSDENSDLDEALIATVERLVSIHRAPMRPWARVMRIFALIRPWDVVSIVYEPRLDMAFTQLGVPVPKAKVMQKHRLLLDVLWDRLGKPDTLDEQLWINQLAHHLGCLPAPADRRAVEQTDAIDGPTAADDPIEIDEPGYWLTRHPTGELAAAPIDAIRDAFAADDFIFPDAMLHHMHAALTALAAKRFAVIGGLSGTGKSTFARLYADALCAAAGISDPTRHRRFVAVRPDWTDPSGLLGHPNLLFEPPRWHRTPALSLILAAVADPTQPYVLILEEMNLARVEHYLAPLLTAMENPDAGLRLHGLGREINGVPPLVPWPRNLFIIGTVNMDATTQAFSDKVLDRAFIWEMDAIDVNTWHLRQRAHAESDDVILDPVASALVRLYEPLEKAGRHFGYRVCDEVLAFCRAAGDAEPATLDVAVFSKVLPRLRGDDHGGLSAALDAILAVCRLHGLDRSAGRVERMQRDLRTTGVARFWS